MGDLLVYSEQNEKKLFALHIIHSLFPIFVLWLDVLNLFWLMFVAKTLAELVETFVFLFLLKSTSCLLVLLLLDSSIDSRILIWFSKNSNSFAKVGGSEVDFTLIVAFSVLLGIEGANAFANHYLKDLKREKQ